MRDASLLEALSLLLPKEPVVLGASEIRASSQGALSNAWDYNRRTGNPERGGLFCAKIFGPIKDNECLCGKYKHVHHRGIVCERCGVEATESRVRRERFGHIKLAVPVAHPWFTARIGALLGMRDEDLQKILRCELYQVTEPKGTFLYKGQPLSLGELALLWEELGEEAFFALTGAELLQKLLSEVDLAPVEGGVPVGGGWEPRSVAGLDASGPSASLQLLDVPPGTPRRRALRADPEAPQPARSGVLEQALARLSGDGGCRPEWLILEALPVLPPDLRPVARGKDGHFYAPGINTKYQRIIERNLVLERMRWKFYTPPSILRRETVLFYKDIEGLFGKNQKGEKTQCNLFKRIREAAWFQMAYPEEGGGCLRAELLAACLRAGNGQ